MANRSTSGSTLVRQGLIRDDYDNPRADLGAPTDAAVLAQGALRFLSPDPIGADLGGRAVVRYVGSGYTFELGYQSQATAEGPGRGELSARFDLSANARGAVTTFVTADAAPGFAIGLDASPTAWLDVKLSATYSAADSSDGFGLRGTARTYRAIGHALGGDLLASAELGLSARRDHAFVEVAAGLEAGPYALTLEATNLTGVNQSLLIPDGEAIPGHGRVGVPALVAGPRSVQLVLAVNL